MPLKVEYPARHPETGDPCYRLDDGDLILFSSARDIFHALEEFAAAKADKAEGWPGWEALDE